MYVTRDKSSKSVKIWKYLDISKPVFSKAGVARHGKKNLIGTMKVDVFKAIVGVAPRPRKLYYYNEDYINAMALMPVKKK